MPARKLNVSVLNAHIVLEKIDMKFVSVIKKSSAIHLIWLLVYLSIVPMQLSNYVLCIGADGHVEFEIAVDGRCVDQHDFDAEHAENVIITTASGEDHCGACIDLAIFVSSDIESYLAPVQKASIQLSTFVVAHTIRQTNATTILTYSFPLDTSALIDPTLISLRTTTLLI